MAMVPPSSDSMMVFHQCREHEWCLEGDGWGRRAATKLVQQGFVVVRVKTENWWDLKKKKPELFSNNLFNNNLDRQQVICTINIHHVVLPLMDRVVRLVGLVDGRVSEENVKEWSKSSGIELMLPKTCSRIRVDVVVVTESSSYVASSLNPEKLARIYNAYEQNVVWLGFNQAGQQTGSKGVMGTPDGIGPRALQCSSQAV